MNLTQQIERSTAHLVIAASIAIVLLTAGFLLAS